jgi:isopenicillin N synthase-like dioxygenase
MQVPTISLATSETRARSAIVDEIKSACLEHGFFLVKDYGAILSPSLPKRALDAARTFFALPESTKRTYFKKDHIWGGYEPFKALNVDPSNEKGHGLNEGFSIASPYHPTAWPEESALPGFRDTLHVYHAAVTELAKYICSLIAEGLSLDTGYFGPFFERQLGYVKLAHYYRPKDQENEEGLFGVAPHSDWGAITILLQDQIGGLEVLESRTGEWLPVSDSLHTKI